MQSVSMSFYLLTALLAFFPFAFATPGLLPEVTEPIITSATRSKQGLEPHFLTISGTRLAPEKREETQMRGPSNVQVCAEPYMRGDCVNIPIAHFLGSGSNCILPRPEQASESFKQIGSIMFPPGLLCNVYTGDHCSGSSETLNSPGSANLFNGRAIEERLKSFECKHITNSA